MTETVQQTPSALRDAPESWAPPEAPLDMPCQDIEPRPVDGLGLGHLLRLILPGQRI